MEKKEEQEKENQKQNTEGAKKGKQMFTRDAHPLHCPNEVDETLPVIGAIDNPNQDVFADALRAMDKAESEGEEGTAVAAPATKKRCASNPYHPGCCGTHLFSSLRHNYLMDLPQGTTLLIKEWPAKRRRTGKSSRHLTWWM